MNNTANRVIKNTSILYAKMGVTVFISLYTTRLTLNALGASDYGVFNIIGGAIAMLSFLNAAMSSATQRFISYSEGKGYRENNKKIFNNSIILHVIIAILVCIILTTVGFFIFNGILKIDSDRIFAAKIVYSSLVVSTVFTIMTVPYDAVLNANENMLYYAVVGLIESFLKLSVAIIISINLFAGDKLIIYGILMTLIPVIMMLMMRIYCNIRYDECNLNLVKYWDVKLVKEMINFAGWNLLGNSTNIFYGYGTGIILNNSYGTILNTANSISGQLNGQLQAFSSNMIRAVNPIIVKAEGGGDREYMYRTTFTACRMSVLIYSFFALPFLLESKIILKLWLNEVPPYVELFTQLIIIQVLIEEISLPLGTAIYAVGKIKGYNIVNSVILFLSVLVLYFLYKKGFPPETLRILAIVVAILLLIYKVTYSFKRCNMPLKKYLVEVVLKSFVVLIITFVIAIIIQNQMEESIFRLITISLLSFSLLVFLFYIIAITKQEKMEINLMFIKRKISGKNFIYSCLR